MASHCGLPGIRETVAWVMHFGNDLHAFYNLFNYFFFYICSVVAVFSQRLKLKLND